MKKEISKTFSLCETEKSFLVREKNVLVFLSSPLASKKDFRDWLLKTYSVSILSLSSCLLKGKIKKKKGISYRTSDKKKFFVHVNEPSKVLG